MLIRYATVKDLKKVNLDTAENTIIIAVNRETEQILGYAVFSTTEIKELVNLTDNQEVIKRLSRVANRQISRMKRSFHFRYNQYLLMQDKGHCPICLEKEMPAGEIDIAVLPNSYLGANEQAQGGLFGKCHLTSKVHACEIFELNEEELQAFMKDLQLVAMVLKEVTGAVKINYEFHGNTIPHLHCHLFPRYLDDNFPSLPIDYNNKFNAYQDESFQWFLMRMREKLRNSNQNIIVDF